MKDYLFNKISIKFVFILITIFVGVNVMGSDLDTNELSTEISDKIVSLDRLNDIQFDCN